MRIFPEMKAWIVWPFSSFTRNVALGRFSTTSPCISMTSSFAISAHSPDRQASLEIRLLEETLVLVRHDVGLHLRHEIHRHHDDDQKRGAAEVERHVPFEDQELRQQADQRHVHRTGQCEAREDLFQVARRLVAGPDTWHKGPGFLEVISS